MLKFFSTLFTGDEISAVGDDSFWSFIVRCMNDLYPDTVMETMKLGYSSGLICDGIIDKESIEEILKSSSIEKSLERMHENIYDDMEDWTYFNQDKKPIEKIIKQLAWIHSKPIVKDKKKIGRNDPCFCGSQKKYKKCCLYIK